MVQRGVARLRYYRPQRPEEIAAFLPETPQGQPGCHISEVFVEDRSIIYAADRACGLYVLECVGKRPLRKGQIPISFKLVGDTAFTPKVKRRHHGCVALLQLMPIRLKVLKPKEVDLELVLGPAHQE